MEGMAEYLSIGPVHPLTASWLRDAAVNGNLPTIEQMTERPDKYFPYRYGEALWEYVGERWGDAAIGEILQNSTTLGVARAFQRQLGLTLHELSDDWREAVNAKYLPQAAMLDRPRTFAQPLLTEKKSGGQIFLAPALSNDGNRIAFLSNGNEKRGELFIDLWLADARTGKRIKRLVESTTNPNFEELRLLYSQSSFSNDGRTLAFTAQREGKDVLYLMDVPSRNVPSVSIFRSTRCGVPSWSPDDKQIAFSGTRGGITDLFIVNADGKNLRQMTNDKYGDLQPAWSPDGSRIAFASDRGPETDLSILKVAKWRIAVLDVQPGQDRGAARPGRPQPEPAVGAGRQRELAFISDRTGIPNVFIYDFANQQHYQITNVLGGVSAITEYSPAITWARGADRMAFTYYESGDYTVWAFDNPRSLKTVAFQQRPATNTGLALNAAPIPAHVGDASSGRRYGRCRRDRRRGSVYRAQTGSRASSSLSTSETAIRDTTVTSVAALNANADFALPDTTRFKDYTYKVGFKPDYIAQPQVGYGTGNQYGLSGFNGGTTIVLSDLLGNHQIALSASLYGQLSDASLFAAYANLSHRWQYSAAAYQQPVYLPQISGIDAVRTSAIESVTPLRIRATCCGMVRVTTQYPFNRFSRFEAGLQFNSISRSVINLTQDCFVNGCTAPTLETVASAPALNFVSPSVSYVSDNSLNGLTGPIMGRRYRFQITPSVGNLRWVEYLGDYRRYDALIFNTLTLASRVLTSASVGRDELAFPKYIGRPEFVRGYDNANFSGIECTPFISGTSVVQHGSAGRKPGCRGERRAAIPNHPQIRPGQPADRIATGGRRLVLRCRPRMERRAVGIAHQAGNYDLNLMRYPFRSVGVGLKVNLFGIAILKWDYAKPLDSPTRANWTFSLGPSF